MSRIYHWHDFNVDAMTTTAHSVYVRLRRRTQWRRGFHSIGCRVHKIIIIISDQVSIVCLLGRKTTTNTAALSIANCFVCAGELCTIRHWKLIGSAKLLSCIIIVFYVMEFNKYTAQVHIAGRCSSHIPPWHERHARQTGSTWKSCRVSELTYLQSK